MSRMLTHGLFSFLRFPVVVRLTTNVVRFKRVLRTNWTLLSLRVGPRRLQFAVLALAMFSAVRNGGERQNANSLFGALDSVEKSEVT